MIPIIFHTHIVLQITYIPFSYDVEQLQLPQNAMMIYSITVAQTALISSFNYPGHTA